MPNLTDEQLEHLLVDFAIAIGMTAKNEAYNRASATAIARLRQLLRAAR